DKNDSHVYLRTKAPNYGNTQTSHNIEHADEYTPVEHDYLFFGQALNPTTGDAHPVHIAANEANRVFKAEGYYNSKTDEGFYYNKSTAWAMQPGLTAVRFDNAAGNVPTAMGAVEAVTRNLLVFEADAATQAAGSESFFHVKGSKGSNTYNNTQNVYTLASMALHDKQDFNAPYAFTATAASYERIPAHFVETRGTAWESLCLPFAPTTVKAGDKVITHFYGTPNTDNIDGTAGTADANNIGHEYWLRELTGSKTENETNYAKFSRPASADYVAYRPYIVSFPGTKFYEFNLTVTGDTIRWEKANAVITVTDDATKSMTVGSYTYTGAFKNETATDGKYVINETGSAFTSGAIVPFRGWLSAASAPAKRSRTIFIGSDYDDVIVQEEQEKPFAPDGSESNVFLIRTNGLQVTIVSSQTLECPCHTVSGASLGVWMIPIGESRFTVPSPGIYILNGRKFVVK
ncbi:MAG: hypothetical protein MJZ12_09375, partial [Prevotella sp.]|nr:hypothetical protein [Prevotella sp.]